MPENFRYRFSVIVPTRNRPGPLAELLKSLGALDFPRQHFEVVLVDDGGDQSLDHVTEPWRERLNLSIFRASGIGPGPARNFGATHAHGEFFAFTDDDCTVTPNWLAAFGARLQAEPDLLLGGVIRNGLPNDIYATVWHVINDAGYSYYDPAAGRAHAFPSNNLALAATRFRELGGFAPDWSLAASEDREFCWRWLQRGWRMGCAPEAIVDHRPQFDLPKFCERYFRYGRGAWHYHQRRRGASGAGALKPDWRFHWSIFRRAFNRYPLPRAVAVAGLLVLWHVINAAGYFSESVRKNAVVDQTA